ncbi:MAG: IS4 family transposase [Bryobacteraceae bacterium]
MIALDPFGHPPGAHRRLWTAPITLWYCIWQWLQPRHTLEAVVADARRGGADALSEDPEDPLSTGLHSKATTSFSDARQRLPLAWVRDCFAKMAASLASLAAPPPSDLPIQLLDGSTKRLRPHGDMPLHFPQHRTRRKRSYWCVARILVSFCAHTGLAMGALLASLHVSEQALAVQLMLGAARRVLYIGDRNFGVWRVVRAATQSGGHALVRLTKVRARRLFGRKRLPGFLDRPTFWAPSVQDQVDPGLTSGAVEGRLLVVKTARPGHRPRVLYLFTTLTDPVAYPPERLLEMYGWRWRVELNFRTVKTTLQMDQSEAKSAEMVRKEFYAGLMAYNLVRGLMGLAAEQAGCEPSQLSFSKAQVLLAQWVAEVFLGWMSAPLRLCRLEWLLAEVAAARLPRRKKPRPNEPRAQYYKPAVFPKMRGSRTEERRALEKSLMKS